ncbi:hypothetical protein N9599_00045 [Candidatus Pelagibacter sp.]|jgi:spore coat polysaccharide biosynthesis protein SpsF|nr:hypothetical protein [Candidatus Pelagibacter sp.]
MNIAVTIQARLGSTRLPGKILKKIDNKPLLQYQIERIKKSKLVNQIIIATTKKKQDTRLVNLSKKLNINYYRGSTNDVLGRIAGAIKKFSIDVHIELISDSPFTDPKILDAIIKFYLENKYQYVSNGMKLSFPSGMEVSVCSGDFFLDIEKKVKKNDPNREHVEFHFTKNSKILKCNIVAPKKYRYPNIFLEVDTAKDFQLISIIFKHFNKKKKFFYLKDILHFLKTQPKLANLNRHVIRTWAHIKLQKKDKINNKIIKNIN